MQKLSRRDALRGTGMAALAAGVAGLGVQAVAAVPADPLLDVINRFKSELNTFDAYEADLDNRGKNLTRKEIDAHTRRAEAILREAVKLPAGAASSVVVLNLIVDEELLNSIYQDEFTTLLGAVTAYLASTAAVRS